jgi:hypothetical protein
MKVLRYGENQAFSVAWKGQYMESGVLFMK